MKSHSTFSVMLLVVCIVNSMSANFMEFVANIPSDIAEAWQRLVEVIRRPVEVRRMRQLARLQTTDYKSRVTHKIFDTKVTNPPLNRSLEVPILSDTKKLQKYSDYVQTQIQSDGSHKRFLTITILHKTMVTTTKNLPESRVLVPVLMEPKSGNMSQWQKDAVMVKT